MRLRDYIVVGIAQGIAALPGVSRSGMTVSTMLVMGVKPDQAFRLSYLAYIPASLGAFAVSVLLSRDQINADVATVQPLGILVAILSAAVIGLITISYLLRLARTTQIWKLDLILGSIALVIGIVATLFFYLIPQGASIS
jgi:undecaprenyl-diphosphatase